VTAQSSLEIEENVIKLLNSCSPIDVLFGVDIAKAQNFDLKILRKKLKVAPRGSWGDRKEWCESNTFYTEGLIFRDLRDTYKDLIYL